MLGNILRTPESIELEILSRQIAVKGIGSNSWVTHIRQVLARYNLPSIHDLLKYPPPKTIWKKQIRNKVNRHWEDMVSQQLSTYPSLRHMTQRLRIGYPHLAVSTIQPSVADVRRSLPNSG